MAFLDLLKSVFIPLTISAVLYFLIFFLALPLYRQHRARYAQYLPLQLTNSAAASFPDTSTLRSRVLHALISGISRIQFVGSVPWLRPGRSRVVNGASGEDSDDEDIDTRRLGSRVRTMDANGDEELDEAVWDGMDRPRDALDSTSRSTLRSESTSRLSIDLEQGFRDSSDEES